MKKLSDLQIQELESFGYIVRSNEELDNIERKQKEVAKEQKPVSVKKPVKMVDDDEIKPDGNKDVKMSTSDDDYSYLDELET
tara:strand:- start:733 stop:978 length:246 start_codon:yes stop_codon:yes gene_type:complete